MSRARSTEVALEIRTSIYGVSRDFWRDTKWRNIGSLRINSRQPLSQEAAYLEELTDGFMTRQMIRGRMAFYDTLRPHSALGHGMPSEAYWARRDENLAARHNTGYTLEKPLSFPDNQDHFTTRWRRQSEGARASNRDRIFVLHRAIRAKRQSPPPIPAC